MQGVNFSNGGSKRFNNEGRNYFLASVLDPITYTGVKLPNLSLTSTTTKLTRYGETIAIPRDLQDTTPQMLFAMFPHNLRTKFYVFVKWEEHAIDTWTFWKTIEEDQDVSTNYVEGALVTGCIQIWDSVTLLNGAGNVVKGHVNAIQFKRCPNFAALTHANILSKCRNNRDWISTLPLTDGISANVYPMDKKLTEFGKGGSYGVEEVNRVRVATQLFTPFGTSLIDLRPLFPVPLFGTFKVHFHGTAIYTTTNPSDQVQCNIRILGQRFNPVTFALDLIDLTQLMLGEPTITLLNSSLTTPNNTQQLLEYCCEWTAIPDPGQVIPTHLEITNSRFQVPLFQSNVMTINIEIVERNNEGYITDGILATVSSLDPLSEISISGVMNYEVIPSAAFQTDIITSTDGHGDSTDATVAQFLLGNQMPAPEIRMLYKRSMFDKLQTLGTIGTTTMYSHLDGMAATFPEIIQRGMLAARPFLKSLTPYLGTMAGSINPMLAPIGMGAGALVNNYLDSYGDEQQQPQGSASSYRMPIRRRGMISTEGFASTQSDDQLEIAFLNDLCLSINDLKDDSSALADVKTEGYASTHKVSDRFQEELSNKDKPLSAIETVNEGDIESLVKDHLYSKLGFICIEGFHEYVELLDFVGVPACMNFGLNPKASLPNRSLTKILVTHQKILIYLIMKIRHVMIDQKMLDPEEYFQQHGLTVPTKPRYEWDVYVEENRAIMGPFSSRMNERYNHAWDLDLFAQLPGSARVSRHSSSYGKQIVLPMVYIGIIQGLLTASRATYLIRDISVEERHEVNSLCIDISTSEGFAAMVGTGVMNEKVDVHDVPHMDKNSLSVEDMGIQKSVDPEISERLGMIAKGVLYYKLYGTAYFPYLVGEAMTPALGIIIVSSRGLSMKDKNLSYNKVKISQPNGGVVVYYLNTNQAKIKDVTEKKIEFYIEIANALLLSGYGTEDTDIQYVTIITSTSSNINSGSLGLATYVAAARYPRGVVYSATVKSGGALGPVSEIATKLQYVASQGRMFIYCGQLAEKFNNSTPMMDVILGNYNEKPTLIKDGVNIVGFQHPEAVSVSATSVMSALFATLAHFSGTMGVAAGANVNIAKEFATKTVKSKFWMDRVKGTNKDGVRQTWNEFLEPHKKDKGVIKRLAEISKINSTDKEHSIALGGLSKYVSSMVNNLTDVDKKRMLAFRRAQRNNTSILGILAYMEGGEYEQAVRELQTALKAKPVLTAVTLGEVNQYRQAMDFYKSLTYADSSDKNAQTAWVAATTAKNLDSSTTGQKQKVKPKMYAQPVMDKSKKTGLRTGFDGDSEEDDDGEYEEEEEEEEESFEEPVLINKKKGDPTKRKNWGV